MNLCIRIVTMVKLMCTCSYCWVNRVGVVLWAGYGSFSQVLLLLGYSGGMVMVL